MPSSIFADRYAAVVAVLAQARREADVTQTDLANRLGRPQSYVSKVERRERRVDPVEFHDWGRALGLDPVVLFARLAKKVVD
jgi:transcriptional regulator with XRE-family HTH domain